MVRRKSNMNKRALLPVGFTVLSLISILGVLDVCDCTRVAAARVETAGTEVSKTAAPGVKIVAYYFHGTTRCATCRKIETFAHEAIQAGFGEALKAGSLEWRTLNVEEPANQHFIKDYRLYTKSVVLIS